MLIKSISIKLPIVCAVIACVFAVDATATQADESVAVTKYSTVYNSVEKIPAEVLEKSKVYPKLLSKLILKS